MGYAKVPENREEEMLNEFCATSAMTFEGLDISKKDDKKKLEDCVRAAGYDKKNFVAFWFKGEVMNRVYKLSGDNAYKPDLTFVVIPEFYSVEFKVHSGARWFDDIVANNIIKQHALDTETKPDYQ